LKGIYEADINAAGGNLRNLGPVGIHI